MPEQRESYPATLDVHALDAAICDGLDRLDEIDAEYQDLVSSLKTNGGEETVEALEALFIEQTQVQNELIVNTWAIVDLTE